MHPKFAAIAVDAVVAYSCTTDSAWVFAWTLQLYAKQKLRKSFVFSKANWEELKRNITEFSAEIICLYRSGWSVQDLWNTFKNGLLLAINANIPTKLKTSKHSVPWITCEVKRALRRKARLFKKVKETNKWSTYRKCQRECKQQLLKAEWNGINKVINESLQNNCTKPFWNYAKSKREDNIGIAPTPPPWKAKASWSVTPKEEWKYWLTVCVSIFQR